MSYFRIQQPGEEPERLLDPEQQVTKPWSGTTWGRCDKCGGSGQTEHECESCTAGGADTGCPVCHGEVHYRGECPVCKGSGEVDDSSRDGISVFPDLDGLYRYMVKRGADLEEGCTVVELVGPESEDDDFDADEGALLVHPTGIVEVHPVDFERIDRLRKELSPSGR
jgi:hypothetical protein